MLDSLGHRFPVAICENKKWKESRDARNWIALQTNSQAEE